MRIALLILLAAFISHRVAATDSPLKEEMRFKLHYAQGILEGITTENFSLIATNAQKLKTFSQGALWDLNKTPEYGRLTTDFQRSADALLRAAAAKNIDGATVAYFQLTTSCVTCHRYLRGQP